jgi:hypothetical protein
MDCCFSDLLSTDWPLLARVNHGLAAGAFLMVLGGGGATAVIAMWLSSVTDVDPDPSLRLTVADARAGLADRPGEPVLEPAQSGVP